MNSARKRGFQKHARVTLSIIALIGMLLGLVIAELGSRLLFPEWAPPRAERADFWVYDQRLGWAHRPSQQGEFIHPEFVNNVIINSDGLRDREYSVERTDKKRLLVLGDSFGWGFGVQHEERFDAVLERKYPDWEVINTSVSGYGTDQQYLYLKERGIAYRPDVVLLLFYANDFTNNNAAEQYWYNKPYFSITDNGLELQNTPVPPATVRQQVDRFFLGRTYLYRKLYSPLKIRYQQLRPKPRRGSLDDPADIGEDKQAASDPYTITKQLITAIWELAAAYDATLVLVSVPSQYMSDDRKAALRDVSQALGMPYLSLEPYFERATEPVTFPRDLHWNPQGHRLAATAIAEFLRAQHLL